MKSMQQWLDAYAVSHQNPTNKLIHWLCVPAIVFSLFGLLLAIPIPIPTGIAHLNVATIVIAIALVFYLRLSLPMALGMLFVSALMYAGNILLFKTVGYNRLTLVIISVAIFVIAWIGQFIGHKIEGEKPSFFEDLQFLMIGPAWLLSFIYKKIGISY